MQKCFPTNDGLRFKGRKTRDFQSEIKRPKKVLRVAPSGLKLTFMSFWQLSEGAEGGWKRWIRVEQLQVLEVICSNIEHKATFELIF